VVEWSDIARIARQTALGGTRPVPAGNAFLLAYADFIERKILNRWKGFNMSVLTPKVVSAAATYINARASVLKEMRRFCEAVHSGLELSVPLVPTEGKENTEWAPEITLFQYRYHLPDWRTYVALSFKTKTGAKSLGGVQLVAEFYSEDAHTIKRCRSRGLRTLTDVSKRFGRQKTMWAILDDDSYIWIWDVIPRNLWFTNDAKPSEMGVKYTQRVLTRYLREAKKLVK
jgi:hypothetical protein